MDIPAPHDYRTILRDELDRRCRADSSYSMAAFAKDIGISASRLSEVLSRRCGISKGVAHRIAERLGLETERAAYFCELVESAHARSRIKREAARIRLLQYRKSRYTELGEDVFKSVSEWQYFALIELLSLPGSKAEPLWVAQALAIDIRKAADTISTLKRLRLLDEQGRVAEPAKFTSVPGGSPSAAIRAFHLEVLAKARDAVMLQNTEQRDISTMIMAFDTRKLPEAKEMIAQFRRKFNGEMDSADRKNSVYCLSIQLFDLAPAANQGKQTNL